jgi:hypothetical protein
MSDAARRILLAILVVGIAGVSLELWLMAHTEDFYQLIPLWLAALGVIAMAAVVLRPSTGTVRLVQAVMLLFLISGIVGMYLHFQVNMEFQLEMDPALSGLALMIQLGLIGLAYTFRHPAVGPRRSA